MLLAQEFRLDKFDWNVRVFYTVDTLPIEYVLDELQKIGCSKYEQTEILNTLGTKPNCGLTYSNIKDRKSIILIGFTTCPAEFQNTYDHEKIHLSMHISKECDIDPYSEEFAYLVGDIGLNMFSIAKKFLCEHCRKELE